MALRLRSSDGHSLFRTIPVLLPGAMPVSLDKLQGLPNPKAWVDFRGGLHDEQALQRLVHDILSEAPTARFRSSGRVLSGSTFKDTRPFGILSKEETVLPIDQGSAAFDPRLSAGLFVGISSFEDERIASVPFAVDDAVDLAHLFTLELGLIQPEHTVLLLAGEPQKPGSLKRLAELVSLGAVRRGARMPDVYRYLRETTQRTEKSGLFVLTLATHGVSDLGGDFLLATDSLKERMLRTGVAVAELFDEVSSAGAERRLVFLDSCRERLSEGTRGMTGRVMAPSFANAIARARGSAVLSASTLGGFAYDDLQHRNGVFTSAVLDGLRGEAKADQEGWITVRTLADFAQQRVTEWVRRNRPDHVAKSLGIGRHIEATAESLPLAPHPVALKDRLRYRERREAALARVKENQGRVITGALWDQIVALIPEQELGPEVERVLEEIEALDGSERSQRSLRDFIRELSSGIIRTPPELESTDEVTPNVKVEGQTSKKIMGILPVESDKSSPVGKAKSKLDDHANYVGDNSDPASAEGNGAVSGYGSSRKRGSKVTVPKISRSGATAALIALLLLSLVSWPIVSRLRPFYSPAKTGDTASVKTYDPSDLMRDTRALQELKILEDLSIRQSIGVHLLAGVIKNLPERLWLDHLTLSANHSISIDGWAYASSSIYAFADSLDHLEGFSGATVGKVEQRGSGAYFFTITLDVNTVGAAGPNAMTSSLEEELGWLLRRLTDRKEIIGGMPRIRNLIGKTATIEVHEFRLEPSRGFYDRIEIVPLSLSLGAATTNDFVQILEHIDQWPQLVALSNMTISTQEGKGIVVSVLLDIPLLKKGIQLSPLPEPESIRVNVPVQVASSAREPFRKRPSGE